MPPLGKETLRKMQKGEMPSSVGFVTVRTEIKNRHGKIKTAETIVYLPTPELRWASSLRQEAEHLFPLLPTNRTYTDAGNIIASDKGISVTGDARQVLDVLLFPLASARNSTVDKIQKLAGRRTIVTGKVFKS